MPSTSDNVRTNVVEYPEPAQAGFLFASVDDLLAVKAPEPAFRMPSFVYVDFDGKETEWVLTIQSVFDRGFVIRSGPTNDPVTESEAADALEANIAGYWQPDPPPVNIVGTGDIVGSV